MFVRKDKSALRAYMLCSTASVATYVSHLWQVGIRFAIFSLPNSLSRPFLFHIKMLLVKERKNELTNER